MLRRLCVCAALVLGAAACASAPREMARHVLEVPAPSGEVGLPIVEVSVRAPSWLDSPGMGYRLDYSDPTRREMYANSRWVAPPAEMLAQALRRAFEMPANAAGACRLRVELDEFVQVFASPEQSRGVMSARVRVVPPRGEAGAVSARFDAQAIAARPDAAGGVAALSAASGQWVGKVREWLAGLARDEATRGMCQVR